jgi:cell division septation protein DedD
MARSDDTEITLGTSKIVAIFFGLVALCAAFFALGFKLGRSAEESAPVSTSSATVLPGTARPSAAKSNTPTPRESKEEPAPTAVVDASGAAVAGTSSGYFVQVAAVSKQEDAEALVDALKKKDYPAQASTNGDKLFRVQVGPFGDIKDAEAMRAKLVNDGYNPILKK